MFVSGHNLFEKKSIKNVSRTSVTADFIANENLLDRTNVVDVSASLKLSFMGGMLSVRFFDKYLYIKRGKVQI